jgi:hypothetical protein
MSRLWRQVICDVLRDAEQMLPIIPSLEMLEAVQYRGRSSRFIHKRRACYGLVGGLVGMYLNSTAALAEVEEVGEDLGRFSISTLPSDLSIEPLIDNYDNFSNKYLDNYRSGEDLIPEAVWSLHSSNQVHLGRIRDGVESQIYTGSDSHFESSILWAGTAIALWNPSNIYEYAALLPPPPLQFQVASCGGNKAEHKDLDICSIRGDDIFLQRAELQELSENEDNKLDTVNNNNLVSSTNIGLSSDNNQSNLSSSSPNPTSTGNILSQGNLIVLDQCDGPSVVCAIVDIDPPVTPVDLPPTDVSAPPTDVSVPPTDVSAPPTDVSAPPTDVSAPPIDALALVPAIDPPLPVLPPTQIAFFDNPEPSNLPPVFTPSPLKPIPEASTWVMSIIGFAAMVMLYDMRGRNRIKQAIVITVLRLVQAMHL